jgi:hypothetical protein
MEETTGLDTVNGLLSPPEISSSPSPLHEKRLRPMKERKNSLKKRFIYY